MRRACFALTAACVTGALLVAQKGDGKFQFVLMGDRTGEAQPGVYEQVWRELAAEKPAFVLSPGDTIQGFDDNSARAEWQQIAALLKPYRALPLYLAPGNHDIWSSQSESLFREFARRPPHYSFDFEQLHVTVLDNSRTDELGAAEMKFLEGDLEAHRSKPLKIIVMHRPSWLVPVMFRNGQFPLHVLAKRFGVSFVVAGHVHKMMHVSFDGVTYLSLPSAAGHLRDTKRYEDGWFFGHTLVTVMGTQVKMVIKECQAPAGKGRVTTLEDWGILGVSPKAA